MLLDAGQQLVARAERYKQLKAQAAHAQIFDTRARQLNAASERVQAAVAQLAALRTAGISAGFTLSADDDLRVKTDALQAGFEQDPAFVDSPGFDLRYAYTDRLLGLAKAVQEAALSAWQAYVRANSEAVSQDILQALSAVAEYRSTIASIQDCQRRVAALAAQVPADVRLAIKQLGSAVQEQREAWQKLTGGDLPRDVILFLRACMSQSGAELRLLTPAVIDWLNGRNLSNAFRVRSA